MKSKYSKLKGMEKLYTKEEVEQMLHLTIGIARERQLVTHEPLHERHAIINTVLNLNFTQQKSDSLIGQKYIPNDNSYSLVLTQDRFRQSTNLNSYLAGTSNSNPIECEIVSEPYKQLVNTCLDQYQSRWFINVRNGKDISRVLFKKSNVNANLKERIENKNFFNDNDYYI